MTLEPITRKEQIIAGKSLEPITRMERFLKEYGGASSWNDLKDKPFYEETLSNSDTLYWDGNTDGLIVIMNTFCKISDAVPTIEDIANGGYYITYNGGYGERHELEYFVQSGIIVTNDMAIYIIPEEVAGVDLGGMSFPESGVYVRPQGHFDSISLTINGYTGFTITTVKTLDKKYLPKTSWESEGIISKEGIAETIRCPESLELRIGETTYGDLDNYKKYVLPVIYWNDKNYYCVSLSVYGSASGDGNYVGIAHAIAFEETGEVCTLKINIDGTEEHSLVTDVLVNYVYGSN